MRMIPFLALCITALTVAQTAHAQVKAGTVTATFLKLPVSARGMGMADALLPVANDVSAIYFNPAGLTQLDDWNVGFSHFELPVDVREEWVGAARSFDNLGLSAGISLTHLYTDQMDETTPRAPEGTGRTFSWTNTALGLTVAKQLTDKFSTGITVKYLNQSAMEFNSDGWAADVGTFYNTGWKSLKVAMIIANFGPDMTFFNEKEDPLPIMFKFGMAMDLVGKPADENYLLGSFEFGHPSDNLEQINLGFEYAFKQAFFLRMGKKMNGVSRDTWDDFQGDAGSDPYLEYPLLSLDGFTGGMGYLWETGNGAVQFDVAYAPNEYLEDYVMFTMSLKR